ncbi:hypothetical protein KA005_70030 [bacterium]|nr:hypothetical protein [bacterium]
MSKSASNRNRKGSNKVTERKRLPYHATQSIDDAIMSSSEAQRLVYQLLKSPQGREEHYRLLGLVLHEINQVEEALKNIER